MNEQPETREEERPEPNTRLHDAPEHGRANRLLLAFALAGLYGIVLVMLAVGDHLAERKGSYLNAVMATVYLVPFAVIWFIVRKRAERASLLWAAVAAGGVNVLAVFHGMREFFLAYNACRCGNSLTTTPLAASVFTAVSLAFLYFHIATAAPDKVGGQSGPLPDTAT